MHKVILDLIFKFLFGYKLTNFYTSKLTTGIKCFKNFSGVI